MAACSQLPWSETLSTRPKSSLCREECSAAQTGWEKNTLRVNTDTTKCLKKKQSTRSATLLPLMCVQTHV